MKTKILISIVVLMVIIGGSIIVNLNDSEEEINFLLENDSLYNPEIDPEDFTVKIDNPYFTLIPGTKLVYEAQTEDGTERIEFYITDETRNVAGVETRVVWDRVWLDGDLIEDTKDWFAQHENGDVWYFGEESYELIEGKVISSHGSWETGVDDAKPGIIMKADPLVGDIYREEYYAGEAEDMADILSTDAAVEVSYGNFSNCLQTKNYTPLEPGVVENKFYCKEVGQAVLEIDLDGGERVELISVEYNTTPSPNDLDQDNTSESDSLNRTQIEDEPALGSGTQPEEEREELKTNISKAEAKAIALKAVPGVVTDIEIEKKLGRITFVVEIDAYDGEETDVVIDIDTGEILAIED
jgi:uncharacterized membrane protein YkoI